jgi:hypothetical protein
MHVLNGMKYRVLSRGRAWLLRRLTSPSRKKNIDEIMMKLFFRFFFSRSGRVELDSFVLKDVKVTLLDILWLAIAYGKMNKRGDAIESMFVFCKK